MFSTRTGWVSLHALARSWSSRGRTLPPYVNGQNPAGALERERGAGVVRVWTRTRAGCRASRARSCVRSADPRQTYGQRPLRRQFRDSVAHPYQTAGERSIRPRDQRWRQTLCSESAPTVGTTAWSARLFAATARGAGHGRVRRLLALAVDPVPNVPVCDAFQRRISLIVSTRRLERLRGDHGMRSACT